MRTKALLITAAIGAGVASAAAQDAVFSVNAVGYVNTDLAPGFNLISNPLNNGDNTLNTVVTDVPPGTSAFLWNGNGYDSTLFLPTGWTVNAEVAPGSGFFIQAGAGLDKLTFVGEVPQGDLSNEIPAGLSINSSQVPQAGDLSSDLGLALGIGDTVFTFNSGTQSFSSSLSLPTGLTPPVSVGVGQAFFVQAAAATTWDRTFSVND